MATKRREAKTSPMGGDAVPKRKRVRVKTGHVIGVPLCDGSYGLAHVALYDLMIWCVLFDRRASSLEELSVGLDEALGSRPLAVMQVTPNGVQDGSWPVIGWREPKYLAAMLDTHGRSSLQTITQMLFEGYYGLRPWDDGWDPRDYEKRLLPGVPVPPTVRYKRDFEKDAAAAPVAPAVPGDDTDPPPTDGPAEIHIEIRYPGDALPTVELLHRREALERALEEAGAGEVTDAGGGGGVMDVYLQTDDVRRALPLVEAAIRTSGFEKDARTEVSAR